MLTLKLDEILPDIAVTQFYRSQNVYNSNNENCVDLISRTVYIILILFLVPPENFVLPKFGDAMRNLKVFTGSLFMIVK